MTIDLATLQPSAGQGVAPIRRRALLYGLPKVGKSTAAVSFDTAKTLYVDLEGGTRDIPTPVFRVEPATWAEFDKVVCDFAAGGHPFERVVVDTADKAWEYLAQEVAAKYSVDALSEVEYGKAVDKAAARFRKCIGTLLDSEYGVWILSHAEKSRNELGSETVQPAVHKKVRTWALGQVDLVLYATRFGATSQLHGTPGAGFVAGGRVLLPQNMSLDGAALRRALEGAPTAPAALAPAPTPQAAPVGAA